MVRECKLGGATSVPAAVDVLDSLITGSRGGGGGGGIDIVIVKQEVEVEVEKEDDTRGESITD